MKYYGEWLNSKDVAERLGISLSEFYRRKRELESKSIRLTISSDLPLSPVEIKYLVDKKALIYLFELSEEAVNCLPDINEGATFPDLNEEFQDYLEKNLRLVLYTLSIMNGSFPRGYTSEDRYQFALMGCMRGLMTYKPDSGTKLASWVATNIKYAVANGQRDYHQVPVHVAEKIRILQRKISENPDACLDLLIEQMGLNVEHAKNALGLESQVSLHSPINEDEDSYLKDLMADPNSPDFLALHNYDELAEAIEKLKPQRKAVIIGRYHEGKTLEILSKELEVSRQRINQIEVEALKQLREILETSCV